MAQDPVSRNHALHAQDIQQDTTRGVDERWTRRLVLDDRQLREGMVLRGNQARARRFMQVPCSDALAEILFIQLYFYHSVRGNTSCAARELDASTKSTLTVACCCAETAQRRGGQRRCATAFAPRRAEVLVVPRPPTLK